MNDNLTIRDVQELLKRWERLSWDLKPQTRDALISFNQLQRETSRAIQTIDKALKSQ